MKKTIRFIWIFVLSGVLFFALTLPFHKLFTVFTATEVRISAVLYPFLGISFGLPAALGIAIANMISDYYSGYQTIVLFTGMGFQFLYTMIPYCMWRFFVKNDKHKHRLDSVKRVLQFSLACFVSAVLAAIFVGGYCYVFYEIDFFQAAKFVFLNNFEVSIMFGCPLMVLANQIISRKKGADRTLTTNEKIIIGTSIVEIIALVLLIVIMYTTGKAKGTYDIWNVIYYYILILIAFLFIVSLIIMIIFESILTKKKKGKK